MNRIPTCLAVCGLLAMATVLAQVPQVSVPRLVSFSGVVRDQTGKPRTGPLELTFAIYPDQESQTPFWQETQSVTLDEQGRYSVQLGSTLPNGIPVDLFTSGKALWLGVQPTGEAEQPRVLLVSVPYALKAADADTLGGKPASAYVLAGSEPAATGVVAAPAGGSGSLAQVSPGQLVPQAVCGGLTADGNAAANQVAIYSGACALTEDTKFVDVSGKIGVGTSAPQAPLDVRGAFTATSGTLYAQDTLASFNPSANSTATGVGDYVQAGVMSGNANNVSLIASLEFLSFHEGTGTVSFEEGMQGKVYNESTGTVTTAEGIYAQIRNESTGTISSGYGLYVDAPLNSGGGTFTNYYGLYLANPTAATKNYSLYSAGGTNYFAGSVGMGTATPSAALEVNGTAKFDGLATFAGGQTFPGTLTGATAGGGLAVSGSTVGLLTSCASGQVLSWSGAAWQCASGGGGGGGTITGVTAGTDLTGGGTSGVVTLNVDTTKVPQLASANPFTNSQTVNASAAGVTAVNITATDTTTANTAVDGLADGPNGTGVIGEADNGATAVGIWGLSSSGLAGLFSGNVNVTGSVSKTGGSFKIDDPIDPANKYLYHSFVESPDMKNIYDGVAVLDANGEAVIQLPAWFGALNRDFRYQLTCIGGFAPVYISQEVSNNQFGIAGGKAGMKVSWQVTGIRQDAWANANRIPVEQEKPAKERGYYLYPELFGAPRDKNVLFAEHPEMLGKTGATK